MIAWNPWFCRAVLHHHHFAFCLNHPFPISHLAIFDKHFPWAAFLVSCWKRRAQTWFTHVFNYIFLITLTTLHFWSYLCMNSSHWASLGCHISLLWLTHAFPCSWLRKLKLRESKGNSSWSYNCCLVKLPCQELMFNVKVYSQPRKTTGTQEALDEGLWKTHVHLPIWIIRIFIVYEDVKRLSLLG